MNITRLASFPFKTAPLSSPRFASSTQSNQQTISELIMGNSQLLSKFKLISSELPAEQEPHLKLLEAAMTNLATRSDLDKFHKQTVLGHLLPLYFFISTNTADDVHYKISQLKPIAQQFGHQYARQCRHLITSAISKSQLRK